MNLLSTHFPEIPLTGTLGVEYISALLMNGTTWINHKNVYRVV